MHRNGIVDRGADTGGLQMLLHPLALRHSNRIHMKHVSSIRRLCGDRNPSVRAFRVSPSMGAARFRPLLEIFQLYPKNGALDPLHSIVEALEHGGISSPVPSLASCELCAYSALFVTSTAFTIRAKVLARIETEAPEVTH